MKKYIIIFILSLFVILSTTFLAISGTTLTATNNQEVYDKLLQLNSGDTLFLADGTYKDLKMVITVSGNAQNLITIAAKNAGQVFITGDAKVELKGQYLVLKDLYFKNGNRKASQWGNHKPGLVAIYKSYNRVTGCVFTNFDKINGAYITTSLLNGQIPTNCQIDHCVFTEKTTLDQVINLNNSPEAIKDGSYSGPAMYHRIDHCFFQNPKKEGNAGGAIRIGYYRNDVGRCLIDSNFFRRQDSEAEIITSKSQENIFYANTILDCQGTLNFRHGDKQIALNNFFITSDSQFGYGGMFVWGSNHIIANNYFSLQKTLSARGNAALYFNPGAKASEHALAFNSLVINNLFKDNNGYAINFEPLLERRIEDAATNGLEFFLPYDITFKGNCFIKTKTFNYDLFLGDVSKQIFQNNFSLGISKNYNVNLQSLDENNPVISDSYQSEDISGYTRSTVQNVANIQGIDLNIQEIINGGIKGIPLTWEDVRPKWLMEVPAKVNEVSLAQGQWINELPESKWAYNFTAGTSGSYNTDGAVNSPLFLPIPPSGTSRVFVPNGSGASYLLDVDNNGLEIYPNGSGATKFSAYTIANATEIAAMTMTLTFGRTGVNPPVNNTAFIWSIGYRGASNTIYSNSNSVFTAANSYSNGVGNLFNAIRFLYNSSTDNYAVSYRSFGNTTGVYEVLDGGPLLPDVPYQIEVYCNNSTGSKSYKRGAVQYDITSGSYHLWVTNLNGNTSVRYAIGATNYNIPKSVETSTGGTTGDYSIPVNTALNAFLLQGSANTNGYAKLIINGGMTLAYNASTLPVSLASFTAYKVLQGIRLNWVTASELNNDYFEILRSTDGENFITLTSISGKGTSQNVNKYSYLDVTALNGINYYKLKQVDKNGIATIYDVTVFANIGHNEEYNFSLNFLRDDLVQLQFYNISDGLANISIRNVSGNKIFTKSFESMRGINHIQLQVPAISKGMYVVTLMKNGKSESIKVIK